MIDESALRRVALTAFESTTAPRRLLDALKDAKSLFGAGSLFLRSPGNSQAFWIDLGSNPEARAEYTAHWHRHDPWAISPDGHKSSRAGRCFIGRQIVAANDVVRSGFYADFGRVHGLREVLSVLVDDGAQPERGPRTILAFFRGEGQGEFTEAHRRALSALQPSLRVALQNYHQIGALRQALATLGAVFDAVPYPVFVLRRDGTVDYCNEASHAVRTNGMVTLTAGRVAAVGSHGGLAFQDLLQRAALGHTQSFGISAEALADVATAAVHLTRLAKDTAFERQWPRAELLLTIRIDDMARIVATRLQALKTRSRLTQAEAAVLAALCQGETVEQIALTNGLKVTTIRTHVRHLLEKTQTTRVVDLVRLARG